MSTKIHIKSTLTASTMNGSNSDNQLTPRSCGNEQQLSVLSPRSKLAASRGWPPSNSNSSSTTSSSRTIDAVAPGTVASAREAIWGKKAAELTVCSTPRSTKPRLVSDPNSNSNCHNVTFNSKQSYADCHVPFTTDENPADQSRTSPTTTARADETTSIFTSPLTFPAVPSINIATTIETSEAEFRLRTPAQQEDGLHDLNVAILITAPLNHVSVPATMWPCQTPQISTEDVPLSLDQDLIPPPVHVPVAVSSPQPLQHQKHVRPASVTPLIFTESIQNTDFECNNTITVAPSSLSADDNVSSTFSLITPSTAPSLELATSSTAPVSIPFSLLATPSSTLQLGLTAQSTDTQVGQNTSHKITVTPIISLATPPASDAPSFYSKFFQPFISPFKYFKSSRSSKSVKSTKIQTSESSSSPPPPSILALSSVQKKSPSTPSPITAASSPINSSPTLSPLRQLSLRFSPVITKSSKPQTKSPTHSESGKPRNKGFFITSNPIHQVTQETLTDTGHNSNLKLSLEMQLDDARHTDIPLLSDSVVDSDKSDSQHIPHLPATQSLSQTNSNALTHTIAQPLSQFTDRQEDSSLHLCATSDRYRHLARPGPLRHLSDQSDEGCRKASVCSAPSTYSADRINAKSEDDVDDNLTCNSPHLTPQGEKPHVSRSMTVGVDSPVESSSTPPNSSANGRLANPTDTNTLDSLCSTIVAVVVNINSQDTSTSAEHVAAVTVDSTPPEVPYSTDTPRCTELNDSPAQDNREIVDGINAALMTNENNLRSTEGGLSTLEMNTSNLAVAIDKDADSIPASREKNFSQSNPLARRQASALTTSASAKTSLFQSQSRKSNSSARGSACGDYPLALEGGYERISSDKVDRGDSVVTESDTAALSHEKDKTKHYAKLGSTFAIKGNALSTRGGGNTLRKSTMACI